MPKTKKAKKRWGVCWSKQTLLGNRTSGYSCAIVEAATWGEALRKATRRTMKQIANYKPDVLWTMGMAAGSNTIYLCDPISSKQNRCGPAQRDLQAEAYAKMQRHLHHALRPGESRGSWPRADCPHPEWR